ncbi:MAG: hypothetical protein AB7D00_00550 [Rhodospirillaceae bacterium]
METKTYRLKTESRQWPGKKAGDTVELPPRAARYLLRAGVLEDAAAEKAAASETTTRRRKAEG